MGNGACSIRIGSLQLVDFLSTSLKVKEDCQTFLCALLVYLVHYGLKQDVRLHAKSQLSNIQIIVGFFFVYS